MHQFAGLNVIVTGATGDIGSKVARKLMKANVGKLCLFVRQQDTFDQKSRNLFTNQDNFNVTEVQVEELDFKHPHLIEPKFSKVMKTFLKGKVDAIFMCHGVIAQKNLSNCSVNELDTILLINVRSCVHLLSLAFPFMKQNDNQKRSSSVTILTSA